MGLSFDELSAMTLASVIRLADEYARTDDATGATQAEIDGLR
jgi:hypothetical protein